jgi:hypothetical protein
VVDGQQVGLSGRWRHGVAALEPGKITFVGTVGGLRFLKRGPVQIVVEGVDRSAQRQPTGLEIVAVSAVAWVVRVATPTATLEWALLPDQLVWAIDEVAARSPSVDIADDVD